MSFPDTDMDGLPDCEDHDPNDADEDDDGLSDGLENYDFFTRDSLSILATSSVNPDSDNDGLPDGLELGLRSPIEGLLPGPGYLPEEPDQLAGSYPRFIYMGAPNLSQTDIRATFSWNAALAGHSEQPIRRLTFIPDSDPNSITDPSNPDTNYDGLPDGAQDTNANGKFDEGETDPLAGWRTFGHEGVVGTFVGRVQILQPYMDDGRRLKADFDWHDDRHWSRGSAGKPWPKNTAVAVFMASIKNIRPVVHCGEGSASDPDCPAKVEVRDVISLTGTRLWLIVLEKKCFSAVPVELWAESCELASGRTPSLWLDLSGQ